MKWSGHGLFNVITAILMSSSEKGETEITIKQGGKERNDRRMKARQKETKKHRKEEKRKDRKVNYGKNKEK